MHVDLETVRLVPERDGIADAVSPEMKRATKEFRIAEIRMEIAKLNFEKQTLRAELAAAR